MDLASASNRTELNRQLLAACAAGDDSAATRALSQGADPYFYDAGKDADPLSASAASGRLELVSRLLELTEPEPESSSLEEALGAALSAGQGPCACALIQAGASLNEAALSRAIARGHAQTIQLLIERKHLRRGGRRSPSSEFEDMGAPSGSLLELALLQSAQLQQLDVFLTLLSAAPKLRGPLAQSIGRWAGLAHWPEAVSRLLEAGFRPSGKTLELWRERFPGPLLAFEERRALNRKRRGASAQDIKGSGAKSL